MCRHLQHQLNINRSTGGNQPLYKFFSDYTVQGGKLKGIRLGAGVQYRGREIIGNRGADTIVDPNNPARAPLGVLEDVKET